MWSVFFVFLSYLDRNFVKADSFSRALDAEKQDKEMLSMLNGTFCAKMSTVGENFLYEASDGTEVVRSVVSRAGKLVNCSVTVNQIQVKSFMYECRLGMKGQRAGLETRFARMDEAKLMCREFTESLQRSERSAVVKKDGTDDSALQDKALKRSKRGFTYPGTLWCGAGNMADSYDQLGMLLYFRVCVMCVVFANRRVNRCKPAVCRRLCTDRQLLPYPRPLPSRHPRLLLKLWPHELQMALHLSLRL